MSIKKSVRLSDLAQSLCQVLSPEGNVNWSGSINKMAERYDFFVLSCLPKLKGCEKNALYEAFNGYIPGDDLGQEINIFPWRISESIQYNANFVHLLNDGGIDESEFLNRVKLWSECEHLAVIDLCERFWNQGQKASLLSVDRIKSYQTNLVIYTSDDQTFNLDIDGQCGEFTKKQWIEDDDVVSLFDEDGQNEILDAIKRQYNAPFIVFSIDELEDDAKQIAYQGWLRLHFPMCIDLRGAKTGSFEHYRNVCKSMTLNFLNTVDDTGVINNG